MHDDGAFDERVAAVYDEAGADMFAPEVLGPTVATLADLADGRPALEMAIGTGRVALPLRAAGVDVTGIELSRPMVARLRSKPGGEDIPVTIGDMATTVVGEDFGLVYLVYSTISNLLTQDAQVACFENAAAHLAPGGVFVVENGVPPLRRLPPGTDVVAFDATATHIGVDVVDVVAQRLTSRHCYVLDGTTTAFATEHRYTTPAELDLMARVAGLRLRHRWAGWDRSPFTADSERHVSVWERPA